MNFDTLKKLTIYLALVFLVLSIWFDPSGTAHAANDFVSGLGNFFATAIDKFTTFITSLF